MSVLEAVVAEALPVMSAAVGAYGAGVLSRVKDEASDATVGFGRRLLPRVWRAAKRPEAVRGAVLELAGAPGDPDALAVLRLQVRMVLAQDSDLLAEVARMPPDRKVVTASGDRAVAVGGSNNETIVTVDGATGQHRT